MKKLVYFTGFWLLVTSSLWSQRDGSKPVTVSQAVQNPNYTLQVGMPILGLNQRMTERPVRPADIRFPWGVLYLFETFSDDSFDISKGYYGDKVLINWEIRNNFDLLKTIKIYRRVFTPDGSLPFNFVANISPAETQYEDRYVEGGVLYEYKLFADGIIDSEVSYSNFITGVGFRNPTAVVTGNVSFEGGNPVKDVILKANPNGSANTYGAALRVPAGGGITVDGIDRPITTAATYQAWLRPAQSYTSDGEMNTRLFRMESFTNAINIDTRFDAGSRELRFTIGGSVFILNNYLPSGEINSRGDDVLIPIENFNTKFTHVSVVLEHNTIPKLFINGRPVTSSYATLANEALVDIEPGYTAPYFSVTEGTTTNTLAITADTEWNKVISGGLRPLDMDEIRIWKKALTEADIRRDFRRYISGNDSNLISYLRANENAGQYAYDLSRSGFDYNKNNGELYNLNTADANRVQWISGAGNIPASDQLGVLGVTDASGNYEITAVPYSGTGESFNITPVFGQHKFKPAQQLVFLGEGSEVVNKIDFVDISSFNFSGKILYDTRGVFKSFVEVNGGDFKDLTPGIDYVEGPGILDEAYNYYEKSGIKYSKGEWWLNDKGTPNDDTDDYLERYARVSPEEVNIYIDNQIVVDSNGAPIVTDDEGNFQVSVPIGNHFITVKKNGHEFVYGGRFPAASGSTQEFFEDAVEQVVFVDTTKVTLVGRVVGGPVESEQPIGFGGSGLYEVSTTDSNGNATTLQVSSKNNIGVAELTLEYAPTGANPTPYTRFNFQTNEESGEYRVDVLPLNYSIDPTTGLRIPSNTSISLIQTKETLNLMDIKPQVTSEFAVSDTEILTSDPYQYTKSFTYRSTPVLRVVSQNSDQEIPINETETISTEGFAYPIYTQFLWYDIALNTFERYTNYDGGNNIEDIVPVIDGELKVTNNLAFTDTEEITRDPDDTSIINYRFRAGIPAIAPPFTKTLDIKYRINGVDYPAENYTNKGIIMGGQSDGSQTFITAGPDIPDIVLRDPPGSNSYASIEAGQTIEITKSNAFTFGAGGGVSGTARGGLKVAAGGGLAGPVIETETINNASFGASYSYSSFDGRSTTVSYTFNQTISTSDDPEFTGADGDLYIGQSKNYAYGVFDDIQSSAAPRGTNPYLELTNSEGKKAYISKQKAVFFTEEPTSTFFLYSQKFILTSLIPDLQLIISNLDNGIIKPDDPGVQTRGFYEQQINLWRKVIRENERTKYLALNDRDQLRITEDEYADDIVKNQFEDNISFDSGLGEISRSLESLIIKSRTLSFENEVNETISTQLGFLINSFGAVINVNGFLKQKDQFGTSNSDASALNISYTLKDNDPANLLSVDVVNTFDGNGPIFTTIGGRTSCPYEGAELSNFYDHSAYDADASVIPELEEIDKEQLSYATQRTEDPRISVEVASVTNIPETRKAEFKLLLENRADFTSDNADFNYFDLIVDNTTNPNNAIFNLGANGTTVFVPPGDPVEFTLTLEKSVSDVYNYENINIYLASRCDPVNTFDKVAISASFVPSCSSVNVSAPLNNWTFNRETAYNLDGTTNPVNISLNEFNTGFNSFQKIDLEYRSVGSPTWTRLQTYYSTQAFYDDAVANNEDEISLITDATLTYPFDIAGMKLADGGYEIRARSTCTNGTEFISDVVTGRVDLTAPQRFGTPTPTDGILSAGEDLKVRFNENIFYNSAVSVIEIKGKTNQLPIDNAVSVLFAGANNTMTIEKPMILNEDFTMEFWMKNATKATTATIVNQTQGLNISLNNGEISFTLGGVTASGAIATDGLFHHYTFTFTKATGDLQIYEESRVLDAANGGTAMQIANDNPIFIGGNTFIGNIHSLRIWNKDISLGDAFATMYNSLQGNEANLIGYYPMNEGHGTIANDLARFKHAIVTADWDIKPKGTAYKFENSQYLTLDNVDFVQLTEQMDATISFWVKTENGEEATLFSNGKGDGTDVVQSNGFSNKWAINMNASGNLSFAAEGKNLPLTTASIADNNWHHVTLLLNRLGSLRTYVDGKQVSSNPMTGIGGFSGNRIWLGVRGAKDLGGFETFDRQFTGQIDEFRLWNTLRNVEQITRDSYHEVDPESIGLMLYARMNAPDPLNGNGPQYFHAYSNNTVIPSNAKLSAGRVTYTDDTPALKPARDIIRFQVNRVINQDEMILEPVVNRLAEIEGQVLDITVHRMFDSANNMQQSPVTWTAFIQQNPVSWYAEGYNEIVKIVKESGEAPTFKIVLLNKGGTTQPYSITQVPSWLKLSSTSGTIAPASELAIIATIDEKLTTGEYLENISLETDFGYSQKIQVDLRVLAEEPAWTVDPSAFDYTMNVIARVQIDGVISEDPYDRVAAFVGDEVRGVAELVYDANYAEYFAFLTVYGTNELTENVRFKAWDASTGEILQVTLNSENSVVFEVNGITGSLSNPALFENTAVMEQVLRFNTGWTWVSLRVDDPLFVDLNTLTSPMNLSTSDRIMTVNPAQLETYYKDGSNPANSGWNGDISNGGGLSTARMYKFNLAQGQQLRIEGEEVDLSQFTLNLNTNWNWLPYPIGKNVLVREALATFSPVEGDVIKSQNLFAIYDTRNGWSGTLTYLEAGKGYMLKAATAQQFSYPAIFNKSKSKSAKGIQTEQPNVLPEFTGFGETMNAVVRLPQGYDQLLVLNTEGVLKGVAKNQRVGDEDLSFITIYGDQPENLVFHIADAMNSKATSKSFEFKSNAVMGTVKNPVILEDKQAAEDALALFPNPFSDRLQVRFNFSKAQTLSIKLFSLSGQVILDEKVETDTGSGDYSISPQLSAGTYFLSIKHADGVLTKKVIKQ
ncbi:LamG-like jellyroll fold domain-containing protein [Leeuwenhoekiella nanhaiensis]|uniref:Laminin G n=1 Tax=Leeuwenhoekiella nanhaiensis TaxID=1655491 RepID=A0A2G1VT43_9FLAO|nr:LamG-like jellyroll fold domain-containing protein [Leeuwenhoekiella nanhaiensis]PHQ29925.1 laminin G [Leeuwenhoekiella nanhaiensis]